MSYFSYFSLPRSLTRTKIWNDLPLSYQKVFTVLVDNACFSICKFDDHGHVFDLQPGQFCGSYAEIKELCGKHVKLIDVERAIKKLISYDFLRQEVRYRKSIITITHQDTYKLIIRGSEVNNEANLRQTCGKVEVQKKNNRTEEEKKEQYIPSASPSEKVIGLDFNENFEQDSSNQNNYLISGAPTQHNIYYSDVTKSNKSETNSNKTEQNQNKSKQKSNKETIPKIAFRENVFLTQVEHDKLLAKHGEVALQWMLEKLNNSKGSTGRKYKSDYCAILNWVEDAYLKSKSILSQSNHTNSVTTDLRRTLDANGNPIKNPVKGRF